MKQIEFECPKGKCDILTYLSNIKNKYDYKPKQEGPIFSEYDITNEELEGIIFRETSALQTANAINILEKRDKLKDFYSEEEIKELLKKRDDVLKFEPIRRIFDEKGGQIIFNKILRDPDYEKYDSYLEVIKDVYFNELLDEILKNNKELINRKKDIIDYIYNEYLV